MVAPKPHSLIEQTQVELQRACDFLSNPGRSSLEESAQALTAAVSNLTEFRRSIERRTGTQSLLPEAQLLGQTIGRAACLLKSAESYHRNWLRILQGKLADYTPQGNPGELPAPARLCVRG